jgi:hypothetical protein
VLRSFKAIGNVAAHLRDRPPNPTRVVDFNWEERRQEPLL